MRKVGEKELVEFHAEGLEKGDWGLHLVVRGDKTPKEIKSIIQESSKFFDHSGSDYYLGSYIRDGKECLDLINAKKGHTQIHIETWGDPGLRAIRVFLDLGTEIEKLLREGKFSGPSGE